MAYNEQDYQRYALPYGYFGVVCDMLAIYVFGMLMCGRAPLLFRKLRHLKAALWICFFRLAGQLVLHCLNIYFVPPRNQGLVVIAFANGIVGFSAALLLCRILKEQQTTPFPQFLHSREGPILRPRQRSGGRWPSPPPSTSASTSTPVTEPPPPYTPRKVNGGTTQTEEFEMQPPGPSHPRPAAVNTRLPSYTSVNAAEHEASADGGEAGTTRDNNSIDNTTRSGAPYQLPRAHCPRSLLPAAFGVLLTLMVVQCIGISAVSSNLPASLMGKAQENDPFEVPFSTGHDKEGKKDTILIINMALSGIALVVALIWSWCEHLLQARRSAEPARVRDYMVKVLRSEDEGQLFWLLLALGMLVLCFYNVASLDELLGRAAGSMGGLLTFDDLPDRKLLARYWLYFAFGLLPLFCS